MGASKGKTYQVEYEIVAPGRFERYNVSAFHVTEDAQLFTLNVQASLARKAHQAPLVSYLGFMTHRAQMTHRVANVDMFPRGGRWTWRSGSRTASCASRRGRWRHH